MAKTRRRCCKMGKREATEWPVCYACTDSPFCNWAGGNEENSRDFKATNSWCTRFMNRYNLVLREKTKIAQKLPRELDDKITSFHKFVIDLR